MAPTNGKGLDGQMIFFSFGLFKRIITDVDGDAGQPMFKGRLPAEFTQIIVNIDEDIMADIIQFMGMAGKA